VAQDLETARPVERAVNRPVLSTLGVFAIAVVLTTIASRLGIMRVVRGYDTRPWAGFDVVGGWWRYDGGWYDYIATRGYFYKGTSEQSAVAFFPMYPLILRGINVFGVNVPLAGVIATIICGAFAVLAFRKWCAERLGDSLAWIATITLLTYPYAFYLMGAVYADALFLLAVLCSFLLVERGHPILAGLVGAVATATRPVGVALVVGLVVFVIVQRKVIENRHIYLRRLKAADYGVLLSMSGLVAYMVYLGVRFGNPLAFQAVQRAPGWDQGAGPKTWFKLSWFKHVANMPENFWNWAFGKPDSDYRALYSFTVFAQGLFVLLFAYLTWRVWKKFGAGYAAFTGTLVAIALVGTKDFQGTGRYLLACFPCFAVLAIEFSQRNRLKWLWWIGGGLLMVGGAFAFGRGYYVA